MYTPLDKSSYLKGLLILARKSKCLVDGEKSIIRDVAKRFSFSNDFYEESIKNLLDNKYILDNPIKFSTKNIAIDFLSEGLKLGFSDNVLDDEEINWLKLICFENGIEIEWFNKKLSQYVKSEE